MPASKASSNPFKLKINQIKLNKFPKVSINDALSKIQSIDNTKTVCNKVAMNEPTLIAIQPIGPLIFLANVKMMPANKPKMIRGKIEIIGLMKNKSVGSGVGFVSTTNKETTPNVKPNKVAERGDNKMAPNKTGKWMSVIDTPAPMGKNPKKGTKPIIAITAINILWMVSFLI